MRNFFKKTALLFGLLSMSILSLTAYYSDSLPNSFYIKNGEQLTVSSFFSITAKSANYTDALQSFSAATSSSSTKTLMLFGAVPIKDVSAEYVDSPLLVPCGEPFGIKLITDGVLVIELQTSSGSCPAKECGIEVGDVITSIDGKAVTSNNDVSKIIGNSKGSPITVCVKRDGLCKTITLTPKLTDGSYKAGMWVRDSSAGIGTITFYDPITKLFGGLGHPICDPDTKQCLPLSEGTAGEVAVTGVEKSVEGNPGGLIGHFVTSSPIGSILSNNSCGVFGRLNGSPNSNEAIPMGFRQDIHTGNATIYTTIDGESPVEYEIEIKEIDLSDNAEHGLVIEVTDEELLSEAGGIVQGMSGSPIIQDGKLVGAVTHVFIEDPTMGYGIFADAMYDSACESCQPQLEAAS